MAQQQLFAGEQGLAVNKGLWLLRTREEIIVGFGGLEGGIGACGELRRAASIWGSWFHSTAADLRHLFYPSRHTRRKKGVEQAQSNSAMYLKFSLPYKPGRKEKIKEWKEKKKERKEEKQNKTKKSLSGKHFTQLGIWHLVTLCMKGETEARSYVTCLRWQDCSVSGGIWSLRSCSSASKHQKISLHYPADFRVSLKGRGKGQSPFQNTDTKGKKKRTTRSLYLFQARPFKKRGVDMKANLPGERHSARRHRARCY